LLIKKVNLKTLVLQKIILIKQEKVIKQAKAIKQIKVIKILSQFKILKDPQRKVKNLFLISLMINIKIFNIILLITILIM